MKNKLFSRNDLLDFQLQGIFYSLILIFSLMGNVTAQELQIEGVPDVEIYKVNKIVDRYTSTMPSDTVEKKGSTFRYYVRPNDEENVVATGYFGSNCSATTPPEFIINTKPSKGRLRDEVFYLQDRQASSPCYGHSTYYRFLYYKWDTTLTGVDEFKVSEGYVGKVRNFEITLATAKVKSTRLSSSANDNNVDVELRGYWAGILKITARSATNAVTILANNGKAVEGSQGNPFENSKIISFNFERNKVPPAKYTQIEVNWAISNPTVGSTYFLSNPWEVPEDPQIKVVSADLNSGQIIVETSKGATGTRGTIDLAVRGKTEQLDIPFNTEVPIGTYTITFDKTRLRPDTYTSIAAKWNVIKGPIFHYQLPKSWISYGIVHYSQYNTVDENQCPGLSELAFLFKQGSCERTITVLNTQFMRQVNLNGTGLSMNHGYIRFIGDNCYSQIHSKPNSTLGATSKNSFLQVDSIKGACLKELKGNDSLATAVNPRTGKFCDKEQVLYEKGSATKASNRTILDFCPICDKNFFGTDGHTDAYSDSGSCSPNGVGDLGKFWTADLSTQ